MGDISISSLAIRFKSMARLIACYPTTTTASVRWRTQQHFTCVRLGTDVDHLGNERFAAGGFQNGPPRRQSA
jgi:hypothetical protein